MIKVQGTIRVINKMLANHTSANLRRGKNIGVNTDGLIYLVKPAAALIFIKRSY